MEAYAEMKELQLVVQVIDEESDTEQVSEDKHDAKAALPKDVPSSSMKGKKPISEMVAGLENIDENVQEDEDHWADNSDDEEEKKLAEHRNEHLSRSLG